MINQEQNIPCPVCSTKIPFSVNELMRGVKFKCPNPTCDASVGLAEESKPLVEHAIDKFEALKGNVAKKRIG